MATYGDWRIEDVEPHGKRLVISFPPQSCASDHQPTIWTYRESGANRTCYCGYYEFRVAATGRIEWSRPTR